MDPNAWLRLFHKDLEHNDFEGGWDAVWASRVTYDKTEGQLRVAMGGLGMVDEDIGRWCAWFRAYLRRISYGDGRHDCGGVQPWASQVDFAENSLTSAGVGRLLETFSDCRVPVLVLKLHHNCITEGGEVATFIGKCEGALRELHLSHNELDAKAASDIIKAATSARDMDGASCYPRRAGARGAVPLWLRLEQNRVDQALLSMLIEAAHAEAPCGTWALCNARSMRCTPHCCVAQAPPAVHAKNLANQRRRPVSTVPDDDRSQANASAVASEASGGMSEENGAGGSAAAGDEGLEFADILRWDMELGRWVRDVIEVSSSRPEPHLDEERSLFISPEERLRAMSPVRSPPRLLAEDQEILSLGLKRLIGVGPKLQPTTGAGAGGSAATAEPLDPAQVTATQLVAKPGNVVKIHRRGSQPSSSDVRQAQGPSFFYPPPPTPPPSAPPAHPYEAAELPLELRGRYCEAAELPLELRGRYCEEGCFALNPQAPEFTPSPFVTPQVPTLNPGAPEFLPQRPPAMPRSWAPPEAAAGVESAACTLAALGLEMACPPSALGATGEEVPATGVLEVFMPHEPASPLLPETTETGCAERSPVDEEGAAEESERGEKDDEGHEGDDGEKEYCGDQAGEVETAADTTDTDKVEAADEVDGDKESDEFEGLAEDQTEVLDAFEEASLCPEGAPEAMDDPSQLLAGNYSLAAVAAAAAVACGAVVAAVRRQCKP